MIALHVLKCSMLISLRIYCSRLLMRARDCLSPTCTDMTSARLSPACSVQPSRNVYGGELISSLSLTTQHDSSQPAGAGCSILPSSPKPVSEFAATVLEARGDGSQFLYFIQRSTRDG